MDRSEINCSSQRQSLLRVYEKSFTFTQVTPLTIDTSSLPFLGRHTFVFFTLLQSTELLDCGKISANVLSGLYIKNTLSGPLSKRVPTSHNLTQLCKA